MNYVKSPVLDARLPLGRARLIQVFLAAGALALLARSFYLQGVQKDFLIGKGEARYERVLEIPATRGRILDRNGEVLAVSTPVKSVWAIPEDAQLSPAQMRMLARELELDERELSRKLASSRDFVFLKRQISPERAARVSALNLPGIHLQNEYRRYYPAAEVTAHVLGFTGADDVGQEGVELAFEAQLAGKAGQRRVIKDRRGHVVEDVESIRPPQEGRDITLALDARLQYLAYARLSEAVTEHRAKAGGIVVLDVKTGEVLALVGTPSFNPNKRSELVGAPLRNRAITDIYEPGSTFKPFTVALALEEGRVRFDTPIQTAPGRLTIGTATISDAHPHGLLTVAQVIQKSSNVGAAKIALELPAERMWSMFDALGFGKPVGIGFPGEASGRLRPWKRWRPIEQATMAYGHGISVSLLQLARAYQVFARDGDYLPLSLTRRENTPTQGVRVFSPDTAREMRKMLTMAVEPGGTAPKAQIAGYRVAGKTGTAHKLEGGVYANKYVSSFVGFAPVSDPRLLVAVMIDEPSAGRYYGGEVAAPLFAKVMAQALRLYGVPQDALPTPLKEAAAPANKGDA